MASSHSYIDSPTELTELEPSPVDETPTFGSDSKSYFPPTESWNASTTTLGISSSRVSHYRASPLPIHQTTPSPTPTPLTKLTAPVRLTQKASSLTLPIFLTFHLANTSLIPLLTRSLPASNNALLLTRPYYQSTPLEPLLLTLPLALHLTSGLLLRLHHRRLRLARTGATTPAEKARIPWPHLSGTSTLGYIAVPLVLGHAFLTRGLPLWVEGSSAGIGLDYVGHGVAVTWPGRWAGFVGFVALVGVVGAHVVWGAARWAGLTPECVRGGSAGEGRLRRKRRWWGVNAVAVGVVGVWLAGGVGVLARAGRVQGWVGRGYDELIRRVPVLGWGL